LYEHCRGDEPRRELGYCTDDAARALVLACGAGDELADERETYLRFVVDAVAPDGSCHNRRDTSGAWTDEPGLGDWWGRAVWGLGVAVAAGLAGPEAEAALVRLLTRRAPYRRGLACAALGAAAVVDRTPGAPELLADALAAVRAGSAPGTPWPWPEPRLTYDNALLPCALLAAGDALVRPDAVALGLSLLEFLVGAQRVGDGLSVAPVGGRGPGDTPPGFDQQPIEVASLCTAGATAFDVTGDTRWLALVGATAAWFLGDNDSGTSMVDLETGAGFDGLTSTGRNPNRGAESTIAAGITLLRAHQRGVSACPLPSVFTTTSSSARTPTG
jgi:hypothetical protein